MPIDENEPARTSNRERSLFQSRDAEVFSVPSRNRLKRNLRDRRGARELPILVTWAGKAQLRKAFHRFLTKRVEPRMPVFWQFLLEPCEVREVDVFLFLHFDH